MYVSKVQSQLNIKILVRYIHLKSCKTQHNLYVQNLCCTKTDPTLACHPNNPLIYLKNHALWQNLHRYYRLYKKRVNKKINQTNKRILKNIERLNMYIISKSDKVFGVHICIMYIVCMYTLLNS